MAISLSTLQTYTLLTSCVVSVSCIAYSTLRRNAKRYRFLRNVRPSHKGTRYSRTSVPTVPVPCEDTIEDGRFLSHDSKSSSSREIVELRKPRGAVYITLLECCILLAAICISVTTISIHARDWDDRDSTKDISTLTAWIYSATLAWLRLLFLCSQSDPLPELWRHTVSLYCVQWILALIHFYSAGVSAVSSTTENLQVAEFILSSCLALIAVSTRNPQGVVITHQADISPSEEPFASLISLATFSWADTIVWRGNRKDFNLTDVWDLQRRDQASRLLERFGRAPRGTRLLWRLMSHFKRNLVIQMSWSFLGALLTFAPTLLLKAILEYMENPQSSSRSTAWLYVTLLAVSGCMYGIADGQAAWTGRKNGMQMESILIAGKSRSVHLRKAMFGLILPTEIHGETLTRKITNLKDTGTVTNLLSVDSFQVGEACSYVHDLFPDAVTQFVVAAILLFSVLGKSALASFVILALLVPLNALFGRLFTWAYRGMMKGMDARSDVTNEVLRNVKLIKVSYSIRERRPSADMIRTVLCMGAQVLPECE
jgi:ABC transporter transmembrane region